MGDVSGFIVHPARDLFFYFLEWCISIWAFPPPVEAAVRLSAHTPWALGSGRYPLQSLMRRIDKLWLLPLNVERRATCQRVV